MALAGSAVLDSGGRYVVGPFDSATGAGKVRRAYNIVGDYADAATVLVDSAAAAVLGTAAALSDARANPTLGALGTFGHGYNGATWDRLRTATADALASTGLQAAGNLGYNGTTWDRARSGDISNAASSVGFLNSLVAARYDGTSPTLTSGRYNALQVGSRGSLKIEVVDADGTSTAKVGGSNDAQSASILSLYTQSQMYGYNASNQFDRIRSGDVNNVAAATGYLNALMVGRYDATLPTLTSGRFSAIQLDSNGRVHTRTTLAGTTGTDLASTKLWPSNDDAYANGALYGIAALASLVIRGPSTGEGVRAITNATDSTGVGIMASGTMAQLDDTSPTVITENQFGNVRMDSARALRVNIEGQKRTYSASVTALAPAASATDVLLIGGSNSTTVRITRIQISGIATAAGSYTFQLIKRSAGNTGGTAAYPTMVPHDSSSAAATAGVTTWTANPTLGTAVGTIRSLMATVSTAAGAIPIVPVVIDFELRGEQAIVLRGGSQGLAINMNGVTMTGGLLNIDVTWTEEA